ncbi:ABC transporter ATP-binding protein [Cytophagales bacterium RKSG123]|nr:ABC transporter ATP-binding protein [Xanthovirga aplysinae]
MIRAKDLVFAYPKNDSPTINGIDFSIGKGEIFGFLGPSGAGKSTTQKILYKVLENYEGEVEVFGKCLKQWRRDYFERIGVGFELPNHYPKLTARENLQFFGSLYQRKYQSIDELLDKVGLLEDADKRVFEFSKGMKMRLNFIRALLHDPEILFFDEPTNGLDPVNAQILKDFLLELQKEGKTIFITTHLMHDADELCQQVSFMTDGILVLTDSPQQLKLKYGERNLKIGYRKNGLLVKKKFELDRLKGNEDFLAIINHYPIETMHTTEASLNDVFIKVTGKSLHS